MGAINSWGVVPASLSVTHSVVYSSWAEPSLYCHRAEDSLRHPYRPRLSQSALRLFTFSCSHSPLNQGAYLCDADIISASKSMQLPCSCVLASYLISRVIFVVRGKIFSLKPSLMYYPCPLFHHAHAMCGVIQHPWFRTADDTNSASHSGSITPYHRDSRSSVAVLPCTALTSNLHHQSLVIIAPQTQPSPCFSLRTALPLSLPFLHSYHNKQE